MRDLYGKTVVITGASSGIGRALAFQLAKEHCDLALIDINAWNLSFLAEEMSSLHSLVTTHLIDVSKRDDVFRCADIIGHKHTKVDILINCAAVAVLNTIEDIKDDDFEWVMNVNFWGVYHTTKAFLPLLKRSPEGHIVNVSSVDGLVPNPGNGPYSAAKAAVKSLTETLCQELHETNVSVMCVIPGGVKTNFHRNAKFYKAVCPGMTREECIDFFENAATTQPEKAAEIIVQSIKCDKERVVIGLDGHLIDFAARLMPRTSTMLAGYMIRNLNSKKLDWCRRILQKLAPNTETHS